MLKQVDVISQMVVIILFNSGFIIINIMAGGGNVLCS